MSSTDGKMQDAQTDTALLELEAEIYKVMGMNESLVDLYMSSHYSWKWKTSN